MDLSAHPLRTAEFLVVDVETNGLSGEECELTEVGAVLVGGGELHDRFASLVRVRRPLTRRIERFTGITQGMVQDAPDPADVLAAWSEMVPGRVLVAHNASFDRGALRRAFERERMRWADPPMLCTVAMARRFAPQATRRGLAPLADTLGIDVEAAHRALPDAETCARIFCALFGRLCAQAATVGEAVALMAPRRRPSTPGGPPTAGRGRRRGSGTGATSNRVPQGAAGLDLAGLPAGPGVYLFRDARGNVLYVGKSRTVRTRARAHLAPSAPASDWVRHAAIVDARPTGSELGALVLENRMIKELRPPGNAALKRAEPQVYLRCRLDIAFPILEVAGEPAAGHAVNVGPLRGRRSAVELVEQLNALFSLRRCGRALPRRTHPSAYGQMDRCLSPCLGDLDPNAYRARLDTALGLFSGREDGRAAVLAEVGRQMRIAADARCYERAARLARRLARLEVLLDRIGGVLQAMHAVPRLVIAGAGADGGPARRGGRPDAFWLVGGRVAHWGPVPDPDGLEHRSAAALATAPAPGVGAAVPPGEIDEMRIVAGWLALHPGALRLPLDRPGAPGHAEALDTWTQAAGVSAGAGAVAPGRARAPISRLAERRTAAPRPRP